MTAGMIRTGPEPCGLNLRGDKKMFRLPSPSLIISMLALLVALGGAGYSATGGNFILGNANSASTQTRLTTPIAGGAFRIDNTSTAAGATGLSIVTNAARPPLVVTSSVKVANLNADKLDGLDSPAFVRAALSGWHYIGDPGEPPFENGWLNFNTTVDHVVATTQHAAYRIDNNHVVHITGWVRAGGIGAAFFHLPAAYCPHYHKALPAVSEHAFAEIIIRPESNACVVYAPIGSNIWVSLEGVSYPDASTDGLVAGSTTRSDVDRSLQPRSSQPL